MVGLGAFLRPIQPFFQGVLKRHLKSKLWTSLRTKWS